MEQPISGRGTLLAPGLENNIMLKTWKESLESEDKRLGEELHERRRKRKLFSLLLKSNGARCVGRQVELVSWPAPIWCRVGLGSSVKFDQSDDETFAANWVHHQFQNSLAATATVYMKLSVPQSIV
jgi:hypothetical protein